VGVGRQQLRRAARREVAAVDEDELGHHTHVVDLVRSQKRAVGEHDASRVALLVGRFAMPGDVDDAPGEPSWNMREWEAAR